MSQAHAKRGAPPDPLIRTPRVKTQQARIVRSEQLTHDTITLVLKTTAEQPPLYARAGQFCTIQIPQTKLTRAYSLARAPIAEQRNEYTFVIRLIDDGKFSGWLRDNASLQPTVYLTGPLGNFVLDETTRPMICIAGGSGMSAIYALIEEAQRKRLARDCLFFYGARTKEDLYFQAEIQSLAAHWHPDHKFEFRPALSNEPTGSNWQGERGMIGDIMLSTLKNTAGFKFSDATYFLCGPPAMIDSTVERLNSLGVANANCHYDKFEDASGPAPRINNKRCVLCDECLLVKPTANCIIESSDVNYNGPSPPRITPLRTSGLYYNSLVIDQSQCIRCNACVDACPHDAISVSNPTPTTTLRQALVE